MDKIHKEPKVSRSAWATGVPAPIPRCHIGLPQGHGSDMCASAVMHLGSASSACSAAKAQSATQATCSQNQQPRGHCDSSHLLNAECAQKCPASLVVYATALEHHDVHEHMPAEPDFGRPG